MTRRRRRTYKRLLENIQKIRKYWKLKEGAIDRPGCRTRCGPASKADKGRNIYRMFLKKIWHHCSSELRPQNNEEELSKRGCLGFFFEVWLIWKKLHQVQRDVIQNVTWYNTVTMLSPVALSTNMHSRIRLISTWRLGERWAIILRHVFHPRRVSCLQILNGNIWCSVDRHLGKEAKGSSDSRSGTQNPT